MKETQRKIFLLLKRTLRSLDFPSKFYKQLRLDVPSDLKFGDFTTTIILSLSQQLKINPQELAAKILPRLKFYLARSSLKKFVKEVKVEGGGFLNFYLNHNFLWEKLRKINLKADKFFRLNLGKKKRVLLEFVSANPTGPLSVAHARQAVVGDALGNILEFLGFRVKKEYYLNDEGNQIRILGDSVALRQKELAGEKIEFPENYYQGRYIYDIAKLAQEKNVPPEKLSEFAVSYMLKVIKKELDDFGVRFDCWYSQKELNASGRIKKALKILEKRNFLYYKDGALWFRSTSFGDDKDRVLLKSDGSFTYLAPDIAYHRDKYRRGFKWLINLWGPDHHGYIARLKAAVEALGYDPKTLTILIVQLATIFRQGRPVRMSTRQGEYITLREVLDEVGKDASRFFFLSRRISSHLDFDLEIAKKQTPENPVYYIQYAHARICSILENSSFKINKKADLSLLKEEEEIALIKNLLRFSYVLEACFASCDPYLLTVYLKELAEFFHKFYDRHRVLGDNLALTQARLNLIEATRIVLKTGLKLLGISSPEKM